MQYKVPQKIDLEDKIIGPLTLKQFIYLLSGAMLDYLIFSSIASSFLAWLLIFIVSLLALAFAFVQVEEQPFSYLMANVLSYLLRPKIRLWDKRSKIIKMIQFKNKKKEKPGPEIRNPAEVKSSLETLARVLDTHGWGSEQGQGERIKSSAEARKSLNLGRTEESEVDLLHKV